MAAGGRGYQLVAPCRRAKNPGCGKHYQSPHRLRSIELLRSDFGRALYRLRTRIERLYGPTHQPSITSSPGGGTEVRLHLPVRTEAA